MVEKSRERIWGYIKNEYFKSNNKDSADQDNQLNLIKSFDDRTKTRFHHDSRHFEIEIKDSHTKR
jgi:hypothetical protein